MNKIKVFNEMHSSQATLFLGAPGIVFLPQLLKRQDSKQLVRPAGINIEDSLKKSNGLREASQNYKLLEKIRIALDRHGYKGFYINARTDTYFQRQNPLLEKFLFLV
ncbi:hypothetical protein DFO73_11521 [Cytobacillus oceanisediminis]|uniref:Uncharacterized protein n=1 Tax=Cytobacillus oceanisediminis TaxID=665099 RepID=A0A2V2ZM49_9BACI|nr:hypothetical protein [Cytobacillus oceanisediminis]PWW20447.1 hypothetical protein DFO73_11521 [Cytobacillus oceanisediminis]